MNKELKPTWDYILNDLAFGNLLVKCLYSEYPDVQDKYDLQYQIKLKDKEIERLNNIINELEKYIKENSIYYNTSDGCQWVDQFKVLDKLKELKEDK